MSEKVALITVTSPQKSDHLILIITVSALLNIVCSQWIDNGAEAAPLMTCAPVCQSYSLGRTREEM